MTDFRLPAKIALFRRHADIFRDFFRDWPTAFEFRISRIPDFRKFRNQNSRNSAGVFLAGGPNLCDPKSLFVLVFDDLIPKMTIFIGYFFQNDDFCRLFDFLVQNMIFLDC
jgi:hypothetical protein